MTVCGDDIDFEDPLPPLPKKTIAAIAILIALACLRGWFSR